jgi:hypothetical protein
MRRVARTRGQGVAKHQNVAAALQALGHSDRVIGMGPGTRKQQCTGDKSNQGSQDFQSYHLMAVGLFHL